MTPGVASSFTSAHSGEQTLDFSPNESVGESGVNTSESSSGVLQMLCSSCPETEIKYQKGSNHEASEGLKGTG